MKKVLIFLMAVSLFAACNNDKGANAKKADYREKDDYGNNEEQTDDKSRKNDDSDNSNYTSNDGWSERDRSKFLSDCMTGFKNNQAEGKKICSCVQEKIEKKYASLSEADEKGGEAEGRRLGMQCAEEMNVSIGQNNDDDNNNNKNYTDDDGGDYSSGGWTSQEVQNFVKPCVREAQKKGLEYLDAQSYCDCMQYKLAKMYTAAQADRLTEADLSTPAMKKMVRSCLSEH